MSVLAVSCIVIACGSMSDTNGNDSSSTSVVVDPMTVPSSSVAAASSTTDADAMDDLPPWEEVTLMGSWAGARTGRDPLELVVFIVGGPKYDPDDPCTVAYKATADETPLAVEVTVFRASRRFTGPHACDDIGYVQSIVVALEAPLGDRTVEAFGAPHGVFDGSRLADPSWLPDGFTRQAEGIPVTRSVAVVAGGVGNS